jgi:hypothetical protein
MMLHLFIKACQKVLFLNCCRKKFFRTGPTRWTMGSEFAGVSTSL